MTLDRFFITRILPDSSILGNQQIDLSAAPATHDSRTVVPGATFFALAGANCDGHDFLSDAIVRGAACVVVAQVFYARMQTMLAPFLAAGNTVIVVADTTQALFQLAAAWRQSFSIPVIGITGSVGKTTTKELLASVVRRAGHRCFVSPGNMNTRVGLSLALLQLRSEHTIAVLEMGISGPGQMKELADLVRPTMAVVTSIAHQHMDCLERLEDVAREKRQIFAHVATDGLGFITGDSPFLNEVAYSHPVVRFGFRRNNQVQARRISFVDGKMRVFIEGFGSSHKLVLPIPHAGFLNSILAVVAVAHMLEISLAVVFAAVEAFISVDGRFALQVGKYGLLVNDAYNANPESMREALLTFNRMKTPGKKIAVLGDMGALGERSLYWHRQIGRTFRTAKNITQVIFVGERIAAAAKTVPHVVTSFCVSSWQDVPAILDRLAQEGSIDVLLKGSNSVGLLNLVPHLSR